MKIYQISGLGANGKVFRNLELENHFEVIYLPWLIPEKNETLEHYAQRIGSSINPNEDFILMGLSFGGIIVNELNHIYKPAHNVLISTIKSRSEMPAYMKFSSITKLHRLIPSKFLASDSVLSYTFFRNLYSDKLPDLNEFFEYRDSNYLSWSIDKIVNWKEKSPLENYTHIHGNKDEIFFVKKIKQAEIVDSGRHTMIMMKANQINKILEEKLRKFH